MSIKAGRRFIAGNSVNTRADVNLSNITPEASEVIVETVIASDNPELNKADISKYATNCVTEIPQRIKYTLEDGTLTIKAGSVVIVPYGVETIEGSTGDEPEVVGTLTVDADGGYSGFSYPNEVGGDTTPKNYIAVPTYEGTEYSKVEYLFKFKMGEQGGGLISSSDSTETLVLSVDPSGLTFMDGMVQFFHSSETPVFISGNTYWVKVLTQNGQQPIVSVSTDGKTYNELVDDNYDPEYDYSEDTSIAFLDGVQNIVGIYVSMGSVRYSFDGTLYAKESYIKIDDEPFWSFQPPAVRNLAEECPIGSKFLHDNYVVVDTQQVDGKCFVWVELVNDVTSTPQSTVSKNPHILGIDIVNNQSYARLVISQQCSGDGSNIKEHDLYYNINANTLQLYYKSGLISATCTLPVLVMNKTQDVGWASVDQVFNGMGYIGSTIWVDKDVKGLMPTGRNENGTLKNKELIVNKLTMRTFTEGWTNNYDVYLHENYYFSVFSIPKYFKETNTLDNFSTNAVNIGSLNITSNVVSNLNPKLPFRAVDINDASSASLPSSKYIDLSLGAAKTTYTAPANGYITLSCIVTGGGLFITHLTNGLSTGEGSITANTGKHLHIPVRKGDKFLIDYTGVKSVECFRFIYAEGEI